MVIQKNKSMKITLKKMYKEKKERERMDRSGKISPPVDTVTRPD